MAAHSAMEKLHAMVATSAIYNGERDEKDDYTGVCHPGTREDQLRDLTTWANSAPPATRVEWYNAIAGAGKTAMLRTFCTELEEQSGFPPVSFFIWNGDARRNTLKHFPATIAYQLCQVFPALVSRIEKAMNAAPLLLQSSFKNQMDKLVIGPLLDSCDAIKEERHLIFVVDGLDELDEKGLSNFLSFIPHFLSQLSSLPISVLVSSRPDAEIVAAFKHPDLASITRSTRIGASDKDIWKFINDKFLSINLRYPNLEIEEGGMWPSHVKRAIMVLQSSGLFIWPTVAINYIDKVALGLGHNKRLKQVLSSAEPKPWIASPLDNLYRAILQAHAPEDPEDRLRFNQRLAYLCLPVGLGRFVLRDVNGRVHDWTDTPLRAVFDETLDELWGSVAGLSSLFSPRTTLSEGESPTPGISHRSLRDFTFNRARCGDKFYYSSEQQLHTEVVCKFLKFFNTRQAYQSRTEMSTVFVHYANVFLGSHLEKAAVTEELGRCMDDVMMDYIPPTWPLVTQILAIVRLFDGLYKLAGNPFPDGSQRQKAFISKVVVFFKKRAANAEGWDIALFRLAVSTADFEGGFISYHSVRCWHIARSAPCPCLDRVIRHVFLRNYQKVLRDSTLFQHAKSRLPPHGQDDVAKDSFDVLQFILSLSETSPRAIQLSSFIPVRIDHWIIDLLKLCPPNDDLYNTLGRICTAPLPDLPKREGDGSQELVKKFLLQTEAFNAYTKRCREAGIETEFPLIRIPDDWWEDKDTREELIKYGYKPPFDVPDDWWEEWNTRNALLRRGYNPPFDIPDDWWEDERTRNALLRRRHKLPFNIPDKWWSHGDTRRLLRRRGYPPPDRYSAEDTASKSGSDASEDKEPDADADHLVTGEDEPLTGGEASSGIAWPQVPPSSDATSSNPLPIQQAVVSAHPMTTPVVGVENGQAQAVPSNVGGRRRRLRDSLKNLFRR